MDVQSKAMFNRNKVGSGTFQLALDVEKSELFLGDELKGTVKVTSDTEFDIVKIWVYLCCEETIRKHNATLYEDKVQASSEIHLTAGFDKTFPFVFKLPFIGRETFHSIGQNVEWWVDTYIELKGRKYLEPEEEGRVEILVAQPKLQAKEIVKEVVLIPCAYCGGLMPQTAIFCPNCGARRK